LFQGALAIEIDTSLSAKRIIRTLERIIEQRGKPRTIRTDNGPEFTSKDFELWCKDQGIENQYIQPGKPMQNGYIERFNRLYREAILDAYVFMDLEEVGIPDKGMDRRIQLPQTPRSPEQSNTG
jgi:putative transposase